jgi:hypothetical protein
VPGTYLLTLPSGMILKTVITAEGKRVFWELYDKH